MFIKILSEGDFCDFFVVFSEQTEVSQIRQSVSAIALPNDFFVGCDFKDGNALSVMPVSEPVCANDVSVFAELYAEQPTDVDFGNVFVRQRPNFVSSFIEFEKPLHAGVNNVAVGTDNRAESVGTGVKLFERFSRFVKKKVYKNRPVMEIYSKKPTGFTRSVFSSYLTIFV